MITVLRDNYSRCQHGLAVCGIKYLCIGLGIMGPSVLVEWVPRVEYYLHGWC
jgi:hypothetical protein